MLTAYEQQHDFVYEQVLRVRPDVLITEALRRLACAHCLRHKKKVRSRTRQPNGQSRPQEVGLRPPSQQPS